VIDRLTAAQTAFGSVNSVHDLIKHPQLRTRRMVVNGCSVDVPTLPWGTEWDVATFEEAPALNAQGASLREEFRL
jgi:crotonobetainyl-CoA:carnitine CoA-transferase CaiB-like acyl-CoA transferase